jgi:dinuclear metal center YbgI/SA1388 family protein
VATVATILDFLDRSMPPSLAAEWDNVGLLLGERGAAVTRVLTCLTVTPESAAEAVEDGAQLIVTHHPVLFRAVKRLTDATSEGRMLLSLVRAGVAVYSPHTAFDNADGGINETLALRLGLTNLVPLRRRDDARSCKVVVFVPDKDLARVSDALFAAGAGKIGQYRECSFRFAGTGTFFGTDATNPTVGAKGRREEVSEWRLEVVSPERGVEAVVAALRKAHSYEEPAYDVYPLKPSASALGEGRVGELKKSMPLRKLARAAKAVLNAGAVQVVGDGDRDVKRVAVACGAAGEFLSDAARAKADVFLTGEMRFHDYLDAQARGVALLLPGHYATERFGVEELAERISRQWPGVTAWASRRESDPVTWV